MKEYSRTKNSMLNMATSTTKQIVMTGLSFLSRTIFIQVLGASYLGINGLFSNILSLLSLTQLGIGTAIVYKLYKPVANHDEKRIRVLLKFYKQAYILIGFTILTLGLLLIPLLPYIIKDYDSLEGLGICAPLVFVLFLLQSVSSYLFFAYRTVIIRVNQKSYILYTVDFFASLATIILQIAALLIFKDYMIYLCIGIALVITQNGVNAYIAHRMYPYAFEKEEESITKKERNDILKDCGALFVFKMNTVVLKATDNLVLSAFIGLAIVGKYSNYVIIYNTLQSLIQPFYGGLYASLGNAYAKESLKKNYFLFELVNFLTIVFNGTACIGLAVCANELIDLWIGQEYVLPQPFPILIGIEILFLGIKINLGQARNISGAFRQVWHRPILGNIINIVVSIILCQKIGICGVIIGTITADLFANFMIDPKIIHKYSFKGFMPVSHYYKKNIVFFLLLAAIGIADYHLCRIIVTGHAFTDLILHIIICGISVPAAFGIIYRKSDVCQYLFAKVKDSKLVKKWKK